MNNFREDLLKELKDINVSEKEAEELLQVAFRMNNLSVIRRSYEFKKAQVERISAIKTKKMFFFGFPRIIIPAFAALVILLGSTTLVLAQKSLPGESLYTIKRAAENVIEKINPNFKQEVIQKKEEEKKIIEDEKKSSSEAQLEEDKKEDAEEKKTITNSIGETQNGSESSKEKLQQNNVEDINKNDKSRNEVKNSDVKGSEDRKIELNKVKDEQSNNQKKEGKNPENP